MDVDVLLERALSEIELLKEEEIFLVKDLFKGYEWNRIPVKDRLLLGTLFLHEVHKKKIPVMAVEKTSSHQQRYQKLPG